MSEEDRIQFKLMVPAELKSRLEDAAHSNRRSLSAEMIARLERTLDEERFVRATPDEAGSESYLSRLTEERLKFEKLLAQYVTMFSNYTPADIKKMLDTYEEIRLSIEKSNAVKPSDDE